MKKRIKYFIAILLSCFYYNLTTFGQGYRGSGRPDPSEYSTDFDDDQSFNYGVWLIIIVAFISYKIWDSTIRKENEEVSDGCLPIVIIGFVLYGIYVLVRYKVA
jgi:hypothetical protein